VPAGYLFINVKNHPHHFNDNFSMDQQPEDSLSISALWGMYEQSESSVKLLLPDDLIVPYYLPKPKNSKVQTQMKEDKLLRRLDIQYSIYVKSNLKKHGLKSEVLLDSAQLQPLTQREK